MMSAMEQQNIEQYDIIIVGGGLVGTSLACALQDLPLKIAQVEAVARTVRQHEDYDARSVALAYSSQQIFQQLGLWAKIADSAVPIKHIHVSEKGRFAKTRLHSEQYGIPALGYVVAISQLQTVLEDAVVKSDKITRVCPAKVSDIKQDEHWADLQVETEQGTQFLQSKLVIAADGGQSFLRKLLNIGTKQWSYEQSAVIANISLSRSHSNWAYERFTPQGPVALLPLQKDMGGIVWTVPTDKLQEVMDLSDHGFLQCLQQRFGYQAGRLTRVGKRASFPLTMVQAKQQCQDRVVIVGNAAHTLHPIAGQGFNLALRDVAMLAQVLAEAGDADLGSGRVLQHYLKQRRWDQRRVTGVTHGINRIFTNDYGPLSVLRTMGLLLLDTAPPLKKHFAKITMGMAAPMPRLAYGLPLINPGDNHG